MPESSHRHQHNPASESPYNNPDSNAPPFYQYPANFGFHPVTLANHQVAYQGNVISPNHTVYPPLVGTYPANLWPHQGPPPLSPCASIPFSINQGPVEVHPPMTSYAPNLPVQQHPYPMFTYPHTQMNVAASEFLPQNYLPPQPVANHVTHNNAMTLPQHLYCSPSQHMYTYPHTPMNRSAHEFLPRNPPPPEVIRHVTHDLNNDSQNDHDQHHQVTHADPDGDWELEEDEIPETEMTSTVNESGQKDKNVEDDENDIYKRS
ncbi:uncharacterized protein MELLADRAFT_112109 [Melampsora larici-populina 98AG31]|uniref:Uncharacterized protein n=1 Tax=Melampsora larici-populina (strain 98AG31 / pathotype 3-4-7) TaxID=747676 RepID=F4S5F1_MELLP|nr:uncharacterized protein MELLADRAFT_112109 [Melampsora larici-populina 98AG31]EGG00173.1 hypothetical protein MELLADRAFT_112109 [Melampsora larici-populina 98AG31]